MVWLSYLWHCPPQTFIQETDPRVIATARKLVRQMNEEARRQNARQ